MTTTTPTTIARRIKLPAISGAPWGYKRRLGVVIEVAVADGRLSMTGEIGGPRNPVESGQCRDSIARAFPDDARVQRIVEVWRRWHLNDMRPGCEHQRADGWGERRIDETKPANVYGLHFEGQQCPSWNLYGWVSPDEHPDGLLGRPCPVCGYGYGTAWRHEELPADILEEIAAW